MGGTEQKQGVILDTRPKPFVFVLMPFDKGFTDVYQLGIKPACEKAGAYAERLDEQIFNESMLQRIYNQIAKADVVVADMTGRNANVFYEVGYAHALGKVVVLLTQDKDDIPFDLKHYQHIVYGNVTALLSQLETAIRWAVRQANERAIPLKSPIRVYCGGRLLVDNPTFDFEDIPGRQVIEPRFTFASNDEMNAVSLRIALWMSDAFLRCSWEGYPRHTIPVLLPDGRTIFNFPDEVSLRPGEWRAVIATLFFGGARLSQEEKAILHVATDKGSYSYPFMMRIR